MSRTVDDSALVTSLLPSEPWKTLYDPLDPTRTMTAHIAGF